MNIDAALTPYSQSFEHFGEIPMQVYDLAKAWEKFRQSQEKHFLEEFEGVYTFRRHLPFPPAVVWEGLVAPEFKQRWMQMVAVSVDTGLRVELVWVQTISALIKIWISVIGSQTGNPSTTFPQ